MELQARGALDVESIDPKSNPDADANVWLRAVTTFDFPIVLEYAGLCIEGRVHLEAIAGRNRFYEMQSQSGDEIFFCTAATDSKVFQDIDRREMQCTMIGLARLNATLNADSMWIHDAPGPRFLSSISDDQRFNDLSQPIHNQSHLTLADLGEVSQWIKRLKNDESSTSSDPTFAALFPSSFRDCLRHRSGHEVLIYRDDTGAIASHRIDAPNPAGELYASWPASVKRHPPRSGINTSSREKRWRLAYTLGGIPEARKPEVFNWVSDTMWKLEEYESTHGRQPIGQPLEYYFDDFVIFANHQLEFELIKM